MRRSPYLRFACILLSIIGGARAGFAEEPSTAVTSVASVARIAVLSDLTGPMASWGRMTHVGAELAVLDAERRGIHAEVVFGDHQLQPKVALSEVQKVTSIDPVSALYLEFSPTSIAVVPVLAQKRILTIYSAAAVSPLRLGPGIFKTYMDYVSACEFAAKDLKATGTRNVGMLKASVEFGDLCLEGVKRVFDSPLVLDYDPGSEVKSQVLVMKAKGVEAIFNPTFIPDFGRMMRSLSDLHYRPVLVANHDAVETSVFSDYPENAQGIIRFRYPSLSKEFVSRVEQKAGTVVNIYAASLAYVHVTQLINAVVACGKSDLQCQAQALSQSSPQPELGFLGWGADRAAKLSLVLERGAS